MGTFLGLPIIRVTVFWSLYWDSSILGKLPQAKIPRTPLLGCGLGE